MHINDTRITSSWCRCISPSKRARALGTWKMAWDSTASCSNLDRPAELDVSPLLQACRLLCRLHDAASVVSVERAFPALAALPALPALSAIIIHRGQICSAANEEDHSFQPSRNPGCMDSQGIPSQDGRPFITVSSLPNLCPQKLPATTVWPKNCGVALAQRSHPNNRVWGVVTHKRSQATSPRQVSPGPQKPGSAVGAPHRTLAN
jgi:hypothetical protein